MQYALVDGNRRVPAPKLHGSCPACGAPMLAKCGSMVIWHWSHAGRRHCDPWWENETEWHRRWKSYFPEAEREIVHFDDAGEKHVADVKTSRGMVIEFQHSAMPPEELRAREAFYGRMMWIVDGTPFADRFHVWSPLPDPRSDFAKDLVFSPHWGDSPGHSFWRKSENPDPAATMFLMHSRQDIEAAIVEHHVGHFSFSWKRPREVWYAASSPVFLDMGGPILWRLGLYDERGLRCIRRVLKRDLVAKNGGVYAAP